MPNTGGMAIDRPDKLSKICISLLLQTSVHWEEKAAKENCKANNTATYLSHLWLIKKTLKGVKEIVMLMSGCKDCGYVNRSLEKNELNMQKPSPLIA